MVSADVNRDGYNPAHITLEIRQGETAVFEPVLEPTEETLAEMERIELAKNREFAELERHRLLRQLEEAQKKRAAFTSTGWAFVSLGAVSLAGSITTGVLSFVDHFSEAKSVLGGTAVGLAIFAAISEVIGAMILLERPDPALVERELAGLEKGGTL